MKSRFKGHVGLVVLVLVVLVLAMSSSCVSKKKFEDLQAGRAAEEAACAARVETQTTQLNELRLAEAAAQQELSRLTEELSLLRTTYTTEVAEHEAQLQDLSAAESDLRERAEWAEAERVQYQQQAAALQNSVRAARARMAQAQRLQRAEAVRLESLEQVIANGPQAQGRAMFGVSYPDTMVTTLAYKVIGFVSVDSAQKQVTVELRSRRQTILNGREEPGGRAQEVLTDSFNIAGLRAITIHATTSDTSKLHIQRPSFLIKEIDGLNRFFEFTIRADEKVNTGTLDMTLTLVGLDSTNQQRPLTDPVAFQMVVVPNLSEEMQNTVIEILTGDFKWVISTLIIPFLTFLLGAYRERRKKGEPLVQG